MKIIYQRLKQSHAYVCRLYGDFLLGSYPMLTTKPTRFYNWRSQEEVHSISEYFLLLNSIRVNIMTNLQPFPFVCKAILWLTVISQCATAFTQVSRPDLHPALSTQQSQPKPYYLSVLQASSYPNNDVCTIQILMSDTGGAWKKNVNLTAES